MEDVLVLYKRKKNRITFTKDGVYLILSLKSPAFQPQYEMAVV